MRNQQIYRSILALVLVALWATPAQAQELPLGSSLPEADLSVETVEGATTIGDLLGSTGTVFIFWSNQCPWIDKYRDRVVALYDQYSGQGIAFVAVNANDATAFPKEGPAESAKQNLPMPYVVAGAVPFAQAVGASRTPHVFVFDGVQSLVYAGTIDDSPGDPGNVENTYLGDVVDQLTRGAEVSVPKTKAFGCTIKFPN